MEINTTEHNQEYQFQYWLKLLILLHRVTTHYQKGQVTCDLWVLQEMSDVIMIFYPDRRNDKISYITTFYLNINKYIPNPQHKQNYLSNSPILEIFSFIKLLQTDLI